MILEELNGLGFTMDAKCIDAGDHESESRWNIKMSVGSVSHDFEYTQGAAYRYLPVPGGESMYRDISFQRHFGRLTIHDHLLLQTSKPMLPDLCGVVSCIVSDATSVCGGETFKEWADNFGVSDDSISALESYNACIQMLMFIRRTGIDLGLLQELYQDY